MSNNLHTASGPAPLVSVAITTFNSEKWLDRSLRSVFEQVTTFPIEVVIGEDCSTDNTLALALSYQERYPDLVRVLARPKNLGLPRNTYDTFEQCRGKYIAWLDADDYWTNPEKLETQIATLESDPSINVCAHYARWVKHDGEVVRDRYPSLAPGRYGLDEIIRHCFLPTPSVVFRNGIHRQLPPWYFDLKTAPDWPIWILAACSGDIVLLDAVDADYSMSPGSLLTSKGSMYWYLTDVEFYDCVESILPREWHRFARIEKGKRFEAIAYEFRTQGAFSDSRKAAVKAFTSPALLDSFGSKTRTLVAAVVRDLQSKARKLTPWNHPDKKR